MRIARVLGLLGCLAGLAFAGPIVHFEGTQTIQSCWTDVGSFYNCAAFPTGAVQHYFLDLTIADYDSHAGSFTASYATTIWPNMVSGDTWGNLTDFGMNRLHVRSPDPGIGDYYPSLKFDATTLLTSGIVSAPFSGSYTHGLDWLLQVQYALSGTVWADAPIDSGGVAHNPEPGTMLLVLIGGAALAMKRRRLRKV